MGDGVTSLFLSLGPAKSLYAAGPSMRLELDEDDGLKVRGASGGLLPHHRFEVMLALIDRAKASGVIELSLMLMFNVE